MKDKKKLIIFGLGEIGELANFYFSTDSNYEIVAHTLDKDFLKDKSFCNKPIVPFENIQEFYDPKSHYLFIAIGYSKMNRLRTQKYNEAKSKGYNLASYISSKATIFPNVMIGDNCFILEDNTLQPFVKVGDNVTMWSGNHLGHHSSVLSNTFITSHAVISGGVEIGEYCFIGVNATIRDHVKISSSCLIGAGSLILSNLEADGVYVEKDTERSRVPSSRIRSI